MKKIFALLLAAAMLLTMTACGGSAEPVETTATTTEPVAQVTEAPTEAPTEEPTEAPTEAPRVAPTDFEAVDPATLPEPIPVEEQLQSEDTQTVTLGSLEEYEDLLWELGFQEVRVADTYQLSLNAEAYCEPVSLTYNDKAFCFDFIYCVNRDGELIRENWHMYGTKSSHLANIADLSTKDYYQIQQTNTITISMAEGQTIEDFMASFDPSQIDMSTASEAKTVTQNYEEELLSFGSNADFTLLVNVKAVYYPITGNLYNYMQDLNDEPTTNFLGGVDANLNYAGDISNESKTFGAQAIDMCFHYLFPVEDVAE